MNKSEQITRKMLSIIRENNDKRNNKTLLNEENEQQQQLFQFFPFSYFSIN